MGHVLISILNVFDGNGFIAILGIGLDNLAENALTLLSINDVVLKHAIPYGLKLIKLKDCLFHNNIN